MTSTFGINPGSVCLVTVTYGNRFHLLSKVLEGAFACGIGMAVVVDNGCLNPIEPQIQALAENIYDRTTVFRSEKNLGSAGGFHAGLKFAAEELQASFVWLLDDDNLPDGRALEFLIHEMGELQKTNKPDNLCVLSYRPDRKYQFQMVHTGSVKKSFPAPSSFLGFHFKDLMGKLVKYYRKSEAESPLFPLSTEPIPIPFGPYGGLFFPTNFLKKYGYPLPELFLYGDDTEFTCRLSSHGVKIFLIPKSKVEDIDQSWTETAEGGNSFSRFLNAESDLRVYFGIRNQIFVEKKYWIENNFIYLMNQSLSILILALFAGRKPKKYSARFRIIMKAISDGHQERLESPFS